MIEERFIELLTLKLTGDLSKEDDAEFNYFLGENEFYPRLYNLFMMYWLKDDQGQFDDGELFDRVRSKIEALGGQQLVAVDSRAANKRSSYAWLLKIAAVFAIVSGSYLAYDQFRDRPVLQHQSDILVKTTPKGVKSIFILSDGTRITLNSDSKLEYPQRFGGKTREVHLSGEAFFDIHHDTKHPFIIHSDKMDIKVLGTAFNLKSYPNESSSETTLIRGMIEVTLADRPSEKIILKPSQKLVVNKEVSTNKPVRGSGTSVVAKAGPELTSMTYYQEQDTTIVETSWLQNKLIFKNEDLNSIARKMERWYNMTINFKNEDVKDLRFSGVFEKETASEVLKALKMTENFSYKISSDRIEISK